MATKAETIALEDELGDILDKALTLARLPVDEAARLAAVDAGKLRDAIDWRSELDCAELGRLAKVLALNEVGLCALAGNRYPLPEVGGLPFCLKPLHMTRGIGVTNAYVLSECGGTRGILFDTGSGIDALRAEWPERIREIEAIFLTHIEPEHAGGLCELARHFRIGKIYMPTGARAEVCGASLADGQQWSGLGLRVTAMNTPGHSDAHNCYRVQSSCCGRGRSVLMTGDLLFAGSVGCAFYCADRLRGSVRRVLEAVPPDTVLAPGHGPLSTVANELKYNPFVV